MDSLAEIPLDPLPAAYAAVPFLLAVLVAVIVILLIKRGVCRVSTGIWMGVFVLVLVGGGVACLAGAVVVEPAAWWGACLVCAAAGVLVSLRERFLARHTVVRSIIALALAAPLTFLAVESAWNPNYALMWNTAAFVEVVLILLILACLYFVAQRHGWLAALAAVGLVVFGIVQNFVLRFKAAVITPSDILAARTAVDVAGTYTYSIDACILSAVTFALLAVAVLSFAYHAPSCKGHEAPQKETTGSGQESAQPETVHTHDAPRPRKVVFNLICACLLAGAFIFATVPQDYQRLFGYRLYYWDLRLSYQKLGFLPGFIAAAQDLTVDAPQGYSEAAAQELLKDAAARYDDQAGQAPARTQAKEQFAQLRPSVVAIMCESYADLSILDGLHAGYKGTWLTTEFDEGAAQGMVDVSVHGGGTCNSEFEFLTGMSLGFLGQGKYPFLQYDFARARTLASTFIDEGYETSFMHPASPLNWDRERVYTELGFDQIFFSDAFAGSTRFHRFVSDGATYDKIIDILKNNDAPQFVFDVTIQNHSTLGLDSIPLARRTSYEPTDFGTPEDHEKLNEYLSCISSSDIDLEAFINDLRELDRPVALVFFGDHQPSLSRAYNDAFFADEPDAIHAGRIMETPYFIWTNYDLAGSAEQPLTHNLSLNYLNAYMCETIGAPLTDFQKAQLVLAQELPSVSSNGFKDETGAWQAFDEGFAQSDECNDLAILQYDRYLAEFQ